MWACMSVLLRIVFQLWVLVAASGAVRCSSAVGDEIDFRHAATFVSAAMNSAEESAAFGEARYVAYHWSDSTQEDLPGAYRCYAGTALWAKMTYRSEYRRSKIARLPELGADASTIASLERELHRIAVDSKLCVMVYDFLSDTLFKTIGQRKRLEVGCHVCPQITWFRYGTQPEIRLPDILTADGTFDFGDRTVSAERTGELLTLRISGPEGAVFELIADSKLGGLPISVKSSLGEVVYRHGVFNWSDPIPFYYPSSIVWFESSPGQVASLPSFRLEYVDMQARPDLSESDSSFREESLPVTSKTNRQITDSRGISRFTKGDRTEDELLWQLGKRLQGVGFLSGRSSPSK